MRCLLVLLLISGAFGSAVFSQSPPPPPPPAPVIYKAPEAKDLKEFTPEDNSFRVTFPCIPTTGKKDIENGSVTIYTCWRTGSYSTVAISEFDFDLENQRDQIYELVRKNYRATTKTKIESEKEVRIQDQTAREFNILSDYNYLKIRVLVIGSRVYEIKTDATNWHIIGESTKNAFFSEAERFFNSFVLLKTPDSTPTVVPEGFLGQVTDSKYSNPFFGFSMDLPKDWHVLNDAEIQQSKNQGKGIFYPENEKAQKAFQDSFEREVILLMVSNRTSTRENGTNISVGVLKQPSPVVTSNQIAEATIALLVNNQNLQLTEEIRAVNINGTQFSNFTTQMNINDQVINQKIYIIVRKGFSITWVLTYKDSGGLEKLEKIFRTLKFDN